MATPSGYKFPILDSSGAATSTSVDFADMFVTKESLLDAGLYMWGTNSISYSSPLGLNDYNDRSSPVQLGTGTNWKQMAGGGYFTMAIKTDGTLWGWGQNANGQLGIRSTAGPISTPVQIGTLTNWKQVSTGKIHTMMIKTDGTLWGCGYNGSTSYTATLGTGDRTDRSSPVQIGTGTNWKLVASSGYSNFAIKTDGTLWAMGRNANGELGLGDLSARSSPTQIGTRTSWKNIGKASAGSTLNQQTSAIQTNGSLWVWGINNLGQLGLSDLTNRSSPTQVGTLTNWKLTASGTYNIYAIKTDGTLWAWGYNTYGQLGLSDITDRSSPVQVGSLTNWKSVSCGQYSVMALKTDGTIWAWGYNGASNNQLGTALGTSVGKISSPVQVGSLTNWKSVFAGNGHFGGNLGVDAP